MKLSDALGKSIAKFCLNRFADSTQNHCAHFVCHVLQINSGYTCRTHLSGTRPGACLRVQELFAECPRVSEFSAAQQDFCIVFVTDEGNVDLAGHKMRNVPKKHVGIYSDGQIYHYSNATDIVIRQTPAEFLARFQSAYGGHQKLFMGSVPQGAELPDPETGGVAITPLASVTPALAPTLVPVIRNVALNGGKTDYFGSLPGLAEHYLGRATKYGSFQGLFQPSNSLYGPRYQIADFSARYATVAGILGVLAASESDGYFNRLNSYDRAALTYGFFQLAAHTPRDNLILLFRALASGNAAFKALFPDLVVLNGQLHRAVGGHYASLEKEYPRPDNQSEMILRDFMTYLNADGILIDEVELSTAARLVHLANTDADANATQVNVAAEITMRKLRNDYDRWYELDGVSDLICTAIADIHHQGSGKKTEVRAALGAGSSVQKKVDALCEIGKAKYASRCESLNKALKLAKTAGHLGHSVFDRASGMFRPASGWVG